MEVDIINVVQYLLIGAAYASVKHYALWEYYSERSFYAKLHHYWFEACFWPLDLVRSGAKLLFSI